MFCVCLTRCISVSIKPFLFPQSNNLPLWFWVATVENCLDQAAGHAVVFRLLRTHFLGSVWPPESGREVVEVLLGLRLSA